MTRLNQLSIITDEMSQNIDQVIETINEFGVKFVELRKVWGKNITLFTNEELNKLKKIVNDKGMGFSMISGPFAKCLLPNSKAAISQGKSFNRNVEYNLSFFDRFLEMSNMLETPNIRIFNFFKTGSKINDENWKLMMDTLRPFVEKAEKSGKTLLLENEHVCFADTIEHTLRFFEEMNNKAVKLNLDPGNFFSVKDSTTPESYEIFYQKGLVGHIHIKDPKFRVPFVGSKFGVVGRGKINYIRLLQQAISHGFMGQKYPINP
jgi:sugar phosphate isomerase/epimerase